jgi:hypothetical protein
MYRRVKIFSLVGLFVLVALSCNTCVASTLVQMQLKDIEKINLFFDYDSDVPSNKIALQSKISELLGKNGIGIDMNARQSLRIVVKVDRNKTCGKYVALYVAVRFEDEVSLKKDPTFNMTNFPAATWQKEFLRMIPSSGIEKSAEENILYAAELFGEQAENARLRAQP